MTALDLDRMERDGCTDEEFFALVAEVRRLTAESEARRLVLALKATELRQEWLRAERAEEALRRLAGWVESSLLLDVDRAKRLLRQEAAVARAVLSPLPAPQPAPEVKP